jgi:transcription elongation factor Elf1
MNGYNGRLPTKLGEVTTITCKKCGKVYQVKYHGKAMENDTYDHICECGNILFTETDRKGFGVTEVKKDL